MVKINEENESYYQIATNQTEADRTFQQKLEALKKNAPKSKWETHMDEIKELNYDLS